MDPTHPLHTLVRSDGPLRADVVDRALVVTLHRPEVANALDAALMGALTELWRAASQAHELRCVLITGAGGAFCSGADANLLSSPRTSLGDTAADELAFLPGPHVQVPVIALVDGVCAGGGLHFVADADIVVASSRARFIDPHVSVGQVSALEPLQLRLRMDPQALARMVLLGRAEVLDADSARTAGLVSEVIAPELLMDRGLEMARAVTAASPEAVRLSRRVLRTFEERLIATDMDLGWELIRRHRQHPDALEGPQAFLERRASVWTETRS